MKRTASLDHLNLTVANFGETVDWYTKVFGFELVEHGVEDSGPWGVLRNGDSMLCVYEDPNRVELESESFHQIYHFGLRIDDRATWERTLAEHSIRTYYGSPVRYPYSISWYVTDPTGHMIEVTLWNNNSVRF